MTTVAIIQARMGSSRLPGKVMRLLCGKTVLAHVIARVRACHRVDRIVVATTTHPRDDVIVAESIRQGAEVSRGSEDDVLSRYCHAARELGADIVVRVTSDCPLIDPAVLDDMLQDFHKTRLAGQPVDYLSNSLERTFPRGLDAEIMTVEALECAQREAREPFEREHVTPFIHMHPERFRLRNYSSNIDHSRHRWTLDTEDDWRLIDEIFRSLCTGGILFSTQDVLALLRLRPELAALNAHVEQKTLKSN